MSHYNVNAGVPKTFIQHLVRWVVSAGLFSGDVGEVLTDVLATEITPELVPTGEDEEIQSSEAQIGPYALQDFNLFHVLRRLPAGQDRLPGLARVARPRRRAVATGLPRRRATLLLDGRDPPMARGGSPSAST